MGGHQANEKERKKDRKKKFRPYQQLFKARSDNFTDNRPRNPGDTLGKLIRSLIDCANNEINERRRLHQPRLGIDRGGKYPWGVRENEKFSQGKSVRAVRQRVRENWILVRGILPAPFLIDARAHVDSILRFIIEEFFSSSVQASSSYFFNFLLFLFFFSLQVLSWHSDEMGSWSLLKSWPENNKIFYFLLRTASYLYRTDI